MEKILSYEFTDDVPTSFFIDREAGEDESCFFYNGLKVVTNENEYLFFGVHYIDCCETVAFAFEEIINIYELRDLEFQSIDIRFPSEGGLLICFDTGLEDDIFDEPIEVKLFVSSYNYQNGHYSDDLDLYMVKNNKLVMKKLKVGISDAKIY